MDFPDNFPDYLDHLNPLDSCRYKVKYAPLVEELTKMTDKELEEKEFKVKWHKSTIVNYMR